jgi:hypothetical protein
MHHIRKDDASYRSVPLCPNCLKPMRLVAVAPDQHFINLDIHEFSCDCGKSDSFMIARDGD